MNRWKFAESKCTYALAFVFDVHRNPFMNGLFRSKKYALDASTQCIFVNWLKMKMKGDILSFHMRYGRLNSIHRLQREINFFPLSFFCLVHIGSSAHRPKLNQCCQGSRRHSRLWLFGVLTVGRGDSRPSQIRSYHLLLPLR